MRGIEGGIEGIVNGEVGLQVWVKGSRVVIRGVGRPRDVRCLEVDGYLEGRRRQGLDHLVER